MAEDFSRPRLWPRHHMEEAIDVLRDALRDVAQTDELESRRIALDALADVHARFGAGRYEPVDRGPYPSADPCPHCGSLKTEPASPNLGDNWRCKCLSCGIVWGESRLGTFSYTGEAIAQLKEAAADESIE